MPLERPQDATFQNELRPLELSPGLDLTEVVEDVDVDVRLTPAVGRLLGRFSTVPSPANSPADVKHTSNTR